MNGTHRHDAANTDRRSRHRQRRDQDGPGHKHHGVTLTQEGVPAAPPGVPTPVSPVVFVSAESLSRFPWLPPRVIAGSVWRGPGHERVRVDRAGRAEPVTTGARRPDPE